MILTYVFSGYSLDFEIDEKQEKIGLVDAIVKTSCQYDIPADVEKHVDFLFEILNEEEWEKVLEYYTDYFQEYYRDEAENYFDKIKY